MRGVAAVPAARRAAAATRRLRVLAVVALAALAAASCTPQQLSHGVFASTTTGVVLTAPANCLRVSEPSGLAELGYLCLQRSPGRVGQCVRVDVTNGGTVVAGITRLPLQRSTALPASACQATSAPAPTTGSGQAVGSVLTDQPRCLAVPLPYPGSHDGALCADRTVGVAGECVWLVYRVVAAGAAVAVVAHGQAPAGSCRGLRRWSDPVTGRGAGAGAGCPRRSSTTSSEPPTGGAAPVCPTGRPRT